MVSSNTFCLCVGPCSQRAYSMHVCVQVLPEVTRKLWKKLRAAVLHYCRPATDSNPFSTEANAAAAQNLRRYAELLEEHKFPDFMFTWNLHWGVCRLPQQELARGSTGRDAEWWTERLMQYYKQLVADRVSHGTEQVRHCISSSAASLWQLVLRRELLNVDCFRRQGSSARCGSDSCDST